MSVVRRALAAGLAAPARRGRLVLLLWAARLVPIALALGLPAYLVIRERAASHPDAGLLLDPARDASGFAYAWTNDLFRDAFTGTSDRLFLVVLVSWLLVTVLAGGLVARLVYGRGALFLAEAGRYAGRFVRLALLVAVCFYALDLGINGVWAAHHEELVRSEFTQRREIELSWTRGLFFVVLTYLLGLVHAYARIDIVMHHRRSAVLALLRGVGHLVRHLPRLVAVEGGMLLAVGAAALLAWGLLRHAAPLHAGAGWVSIGVFLALALLTSYLRTGLEVGAMDARCHVLGEGREPPASAPPQSRNETLPSLEG